MRRGWTLVLAVGLAILVGGLWPASAPTRPGVVGFATDPWWRLDKLQHLVAFGILGAALARVMDGWAAFTITVLAGLLLEGAQAFVPGRQASVVDAAANAVGALAAVIATAWVRWPVARSQRGDRHAESAP